MADDGAGTAGGWVEFGRRLRARRREARLTQRQLGTKAGYDHTVISKVENGRREPPPGLARRLDAILGTGGELAAILDARPARRQGPLGDAVFAPLPGGREPDVEVRPDAAGWPAGLPEYGLACPLHGEVGCPVPTPADAYGLVVALRDGLRRDCSAAVDADVVHGLAAMLVWYTRAGAEEMSTAMVAPVESLLRLTVGWAEADNRARRMPAVPLRLAAHYAQLAGRLRMQRGQRGVAMAWFGQGLRWAEICDHLVVRATLLSDVCTLTRIDQDPVSALAYARALARVDPHRRWVETLAHVYQARAYALHGDRDGCRRHIGRARRALARPTDRDRVEAPWMCGVDGELRVETAIAGALRDLAALTASRTAGHQAVAASAHALSCVPGRMRPTRLLLTLRLADSYACAGRPEEALAVAEPVVAEAARSRRTTLVEELRGLRARLAAGWPGAAPVRDFQGRLAELGG